MTKLLSIILLTLIFTKFESLAAPASCELLYVGHKDAIDVYLTQKYPKLKMITEDPDAFVKEMEDLFEKQKLIDPKNPHGFDYSKVALPVVKYAVESMDKKSEGLLEFRSRLERLIKSKNPIRIMNRKKLKAKLDEVNIAIIFMRDLKLEGERILEKNLVTYRESVEYLYYFSRAIGHFDARQFKFTTRTWLSVDRYLQGYEQTSITSEYVMYLNRNFNMFEKPSPVGGFKKAAQSFETAFANKDTLETIIVPTAEAIDRDILIRNMTNKISIIGVTADPIAADGFLRPGGDFWVHDARHESAIHFKRQEYITKRNPTESQLKKLDDLQEVWMVELHRELEHMVDSDLREAISLMAFNFHHDRGFPLIPSVWLTGKHNFVMHGLIFMLVISGQGTGYKNIVKNSLKARQWLTEFWKERSKSEELVFAGQ